MQSNEIRDKFLKFFEKRGHKIIPSASLVPENDPTTLFNTAGMQPLVPYLLGQVHPQGTRLVDYQKCLRTGDIDDVGDNRHNTFFEMLGNWSLGDYFKKESLPWSFEFLTNKEEGLGLDPNRFYVTVFKGENEIPRDDESIKIWQDIFTKYGISSDVATEDEIVKDNIRIIPLGVDDNFWIAGTTGPCGSDSEFFYDTRPEEGKLEGKFQDLVDSFRLIEVWNNVFMEFNKTVDGKYEILTTKNVDTGMGLERTTAVVNGKDNIFDTDLFELVLVKISELTKNDDMRAKRIVADHIRAAVFIIADGVVPSNTDRGYVLRRLLRRAVRYSDVLGMQANSLISLVDIVVAKYADVYDNLKSQIETIKQEISKEENKFRLTIKNGMRKFEEVTKHINIFVLDTVNVTDSDVKPEVVKQPKGQANNIREEKIMTGKQAFDLYQSDGFPIELTTEIAKERGIIVDVQGFYLEMSKHQELSKSGSGERFKGGLGGSSDQIVKYHTATHLFQQALIDVLGPEVAQKGSNITEERLRFDFVWSTKMTDEEKQKVEQIVNEKIEANLSVNKVILPIAEAEKTGARHLFNEKYGDEVSIYFVGGNLETAYSKEFCGGPHVENTGTLGHFKIIKEEAIAAGVRRIKAVLE